MATSFQLLIATPGFDDPFFEKTVSILLDHSQDGAMGVILNRSLSVNAHDILDQSYLDEKDPDGRWVDCLKSIPVYWGGPLESTRAFILHNEATVAENDTEIAPGWYISSSLLALEHYCMLDKDQTTNQLQFILGYAGWSQGQLESELKKDIWLELPVQATLFDKPRDRLWEDILQQQDISLANWAPPTSSNVH